MMLPHVQSDQQSIRLRARLNWRGYFLRFCAAHGGDPIEHGGRLLFRDGWRYSATDCRGPEWPPRDAAEADRLARIYWTERRRALTYERRELEIHIVGLREIIAARPVPPQAAQWNPDRERYSSSGVGDLDLVPLEERLRQLSVSIEECDDGLRH